MHKQMSMTPKIAEANYGFQKGKTACSEEVHDWAGEFIHNFVWDLEFYLKRVPELKDEMSTYFFRMFFKKYPEETGTSLGYLHDGCKISPLDRKSPNFLLIFRP